jgi:PPK2 family polyphosphate:nucleotide phosphotransferase
MNHEHILVPPGEKIRLKDFDPAFTGGFKNKAEATKKLKADVDKLAELQDVLYAQNTYSVLLIFQAMDAAGKDGAIKHVMSGINPQGCQVVSFKGPSAEELDHDFLWRCMKSLPERGRIGIFNRSYYEEVLVVRVHPEFLKAQNLPPGTMNENIWKKRYEDINNIERYLVRNGTVILKFFLNVSKAEQKKRFLERINTPDKNWKFSKADVQERGHWKEYMEAYEDLLNNTSTKGAPWFVIPADHKWFTRAAVADVIVKQLLSLDLHYPQLEANHKAQLQEAKKILESE